MPAGRDFTAMIFRNLNRNLAVAGARSCDAPGASVAAKPNGVAGFSRDGGVASTFCDEASQLRARSFAFQLHGSSLILIF
jgi:hypothetical protein